MAADNILQLIGREVPDVDWQTASELVLPYAGRTVIEMAPVPLGGQVLVTQGQDVEWRLRPDVGVVLAAGDGVPLLPGELVAVDHAHGKRLVNFEIGPYVAKDEVRMYGCACRSGGTAVKVPWWRSILAFVDYEAEVPLRATGGNVLVDRGDLIDQVDLGEGRKLYLTENESFRGSNGIVVNIGADVDGEIRPGARVFYMANLAKPVKGLSKNYVIIPQEGILCEVAQEQEAA